MRKNYLLLGAQNIRYAVSVFSPWIDHKGGEGKIEIRDEAINNVPEMTRLFFLYIWIACILLQKLEAKA